MRAVVQRVRRAEVSVGGQVQAQIGAGLVVLLGIERGDGLPEADWLARKLLTLRCFADGPHAFQRSVQDLPGDVLVVPQFTVCGDCRHGRRPDFSRAAPAEDARRLYEAVLGLLERAAVTVRRGAFQEQMVVALDNDGPVTFILDTGSRPPGGEAAAS